MLIPSRSDTKTKAETSLSRRVNANSQPMLSGSMSHVKLIKKGEC